MALGFIGVNVMLGGIASFLEQSLSQEFDAFRLGAALRLGALVLVTAALAVVFRHQAITPRQVVVAATTLVGVSLLTLPQP